MNKFDAIVIGGGPAGSTVAGFLTKMGRSVLVLERERFPRHHIGESMIASTLDILAEIGLEEKIDAAGFPVKSGGCFVWGELPDPWCIRFDEIPGRPTSYQVKRDVFDTILLEHAAELGAEVIQEARVTDIHVENGRVRGVTFEHGGVANDAEASYVVDASGLGAIVANRLSTRQAVDELKNMALYGYWKGVHPPPAKLGGDIRPEDRNNIIIKMLDTGWLWFIPLGFDDLISVGYVSHRHNLPEGAGRADLEDHYQARITSSEEFSYLLSNSEYTGEFHTIRDWSYRSAEMAGPGYFAVGDAACFVDPILSSGVYLAVLYAKMCAVGINTCLDMPGQERLVADWYEALYADTYSDYLEMARLWYHGDRRVQSWMQEAQLRLDDEVEAEYTQTDRSSFIGLATGNAHTHPRYVLMRALDSFPVPLLLRKDARSGFHREAQAALIAHADPETLEPDDMALKTTAQTGMKSSRQARIAIAGLFDTLPEPVIRLSQRNGETQVEQGDQVGLHPGAKLSLEVMEDRVAMVLTSPWGERRIVTPSEQETLTSLVSNSPLHGGDEFTDELHDAGLLTPI